jgi:hypothetical protein
MPAGGVLRASGNRAKNPKRLVWHLKEETFRQGYQR